MYRVYIGWNLVEYVDIDADHFEVVASDGKQGLVRFSKEDEIVATTPWPATIIPSPVAVSE